MSDVKTATFRKQHEDIIILINSILNSLEFEVLKVNSHGIKKLLTKLSNIVRIHIILEDSALYPILEKIDNVDIRTKSRHFMNEMLVISETYSNYIEKWTAGSSIKEDTENFIDETRTIMEALLNRFERENTDLYEIVDRL